ncbi:MAG: lipopolysaccharide biosynthesis protein [Candidatus Woesearchaeota archaeon]
MKLLKNFSIYSFGKILVEGLKFFLIPVYTKYIPLDQYGVLNVLNSIKNMGTHFFSQISQAAQNRFYFKDRDKEAFYPSIFTIFSIGFSLLFLLSIIFYDFIAISLFSPFPELSYIYWLMLFVGLFEFIIHLTQNKNTLESRSLSFVFISIFQGIGSLVLTIYLVVVRSMTIDGVVLSLFIIYLLLSIYIMTQTARHIFKKPDIKLIKKYFSYGIPLAFAAIASILLTSGDRFIIKFYLDNDAVGAYSFIYLISSVLFSFVIRPFSRVMNPLIMKSEGKLKQLDKIIKNSIKSILVAVSFASLFFVFFIKYFLEVFVSNKDYLLFYDLIYILSLGVIMQSFMGFVSKGMVFSNKSGHMSFSTITFAIINVVLNFILIPIMGIYGAAYATAISYAGMTITIIYFSEKFHPLRYPKMTIFLIILCYVFSLGLFFLFRPIINEILLKTLIILLYPILLFMIGILNKKNIKFLIKTIKRN